MAGTVKIALSGRLGSGKYALISEKDKALVEKIRWHLNDMGYAVNRTHHKTIRMHRLIVQPPEGLVVDHINHDRLDNRRENLKPCTQAENTRNRADMGKGYWFQKQNGNWVVELNGRHIGVFVTEEEAQKIVSLVRSGGVYVKPARTVCRWGHDITGGGAYRYDRSVICKKCQSKRSREYYERTTKHRLDGNNG